MYEDPRTSIPRYVGKGKGSRATRHLKYGARSNKQLRNMIQSCRDDGIDVNPIILKCPSEMSAIAIERFWIKVIGRKDQGTGPLFNHTDGGDGRSGYKASPETLQKMSAAMSGERHPAFGKTGVNCPNFGRKLTPDQRLSISRTLKGRKQDPEVVAQRALSNTGKKRTEEQRANLRAGQAKRRAAKAMTS
jgi:hypothetical protein